jgi:hypothetical protein
MKTMHCLDMKVLPFDHSCTDIVRQFKINKYWFVSIHYWSGFKIQIMITESAALSKTYVSAVSSMSAWTIMDSMLCHLHKHEYTPKFCDFHSGVYEESTLLWYHAASLSEQLYNMLRKKWFPSQHTAHQIGLEEMRVLLRCSICSQLFLLSTAVINEWILQ